MRNISYVPCSADLSHPADRRRIRIWAESVGITLHLEDIKPNDVLVLSSAANLRYWVSKHKGPVVIDLVDGYLSHNVGLVEDILRNSVRSTLGKSSFRSLTFTNELRFAVSRASAIVVSCPEQRDSVIDLNPNVHCILDNHSELKSPLVQQERSKAETFTLIWEGLGYTLKHLFHIADDLEKFLYECDARLIVVTNPTYRKWSTKLGKVDSITLLKNQFKTVWNKIEFVDWSIENLIKSVQDSDFAIIPLDLRDDFAVNKPENKLLSFWTMGIPTLCSASLAYKRVLTATHSEDLLITDSHWLAPLRRALEMNQKKGGLLAPKLRIYQEYLEKFHTKDSLVQKWDAVIRPLMN